MKWELPPLPEAAAPLPDAAPPLAEAQTKLLKSFMEPKLLQKIFKNSVEKYVYFFNVFFFNGWPYSFL